MTGISGDPESPFNDAPDFSFLHQSGHSRSGYFCTTPVQFDCDPGTAISAFTIRIYF